MPVARAAASYLPSDTLLTLRNATDVPRRLRGRPHEPDFQLLGDLDLDGAAILDVGANRGQALASIATAVESPELHAVEPNPVLAEYLRTKWGARVSVYETALGDQPGTFAMHIPRYGHTLWDTRASLDRDVAQSFLSPDRFWRFDEHRCAVETIDIEVTTMDSLGILPAFVKIDVEGAEHQVVAGGRTTIAHALPVLLIEEPGSLTVAALADMGYRPYRYEPDSGTLVEADLSGLNAFFFTDDHITSLRLGSRVRSPGL